MARSFWRTSISLTLLMAACISNGRAQSDEDRKTLERARSAYRVQNQPNSIACDVQLDWDAFFQKLKVEQTPEVKAQIEKMKAIKISFVSEGQNRTTVKVDAPDVSSSMADGLRQQITGFFDLYWSQAYGRLLAAKPDERFELASSPEGYHLKSSVGAMTVEVAMDTAYLVTSETVTSPQLTAVVTPIFKPGEDGVLWLRSLDETADMGASKMVVHFSLDYQKAGAYHVPQHVEMSLPGSYSFDYQFSSCIAKGAVDGGPASAK